MTLPEHAAGPRPGPRPGPSSDALADLRAAMDALPAEPDDDTDPADDATRFEAVHEALVAVLADVDRT